MFYDSHWQSRSIDWELSCSSSEALDVLDLSFIEPKSLFPGLKHFNGPSCQGRVNDNYFSIWPKKEWFQYTPIWGHSVIFDGEVIAKGEASQLSGSININPVLRIVPFGYKRFAISMISMSIIVPLIIVAFSVPKLDFLQPPIPVIPVVLLILFFGYLNHDARGDLEDMDRFYTKVFSKYRELPNNLE